MSLTQHSGTLPGPISARLSLPAPSEGGFVIGAQWWTTGQSILLRAAVIGQAQSMAFNQSRRKDRMPKSGPIDSPIKVRLATPALR